jgi:hypothetical protein
MLILEIFDGLLLLFRVQVQFYPLLSLRRWTDVESQVIQIDQKWDLLYQLYMLVLEVLLDHQVIENVGDY